MHKLCANFDQISTQRSKVDMKSHISMGLLEIDRFWERKRVGEPVLVGFHTDSDKFEDCSSKGQC